MPKVLESPHKIISLHVLATGRMILVTENRAYEQKDGLWTPMAFADDPVDPEPAKPAPTYDGVNHPDKVKTDPLWAKPEPQA